MIDFITHIFQTGIRKMCVNFRIRISLS
jgi:hypothetical protein